MKNKFWDYLSDFLYDHICVCGINDAYYETIYNPQDNEHHISILDAIDEMANELEIEGYDMNYEICPCGDYIAVNVEWFDGLIPNSVIFFVKRNTVEED